jgi:zinc transport system substrate-binding protein
MNTQSKIQIPKSKIPISQTRTLILALCFAIILLVSVSTASSVPSDKLIVYVVNYPLKYFAERIGGDHANYAKWVNKVSLPRFRLVNTSASFRNQYIEAAAILTHSHGPAGKHAHEALAFTTWIDLSLAARQAKAIADALSRKNPKQRNLFQKNYKALEKDLMALDRDIQAVVSKDPTKPLLVSHPVYDYFARRYGLNIRSVHWEPDEMPNSGQWLELQKILKEHPAKWMIWEGEPMGKSVERLKSIGVNSLVFDPCGNVPEQGDFISVMRQNAENLKLVFQ